MIFKLSNTVEIELAKAPRLIETVFKEGKSSSN